MADAQTKEQEAPIEEKQVTRREFLNLAWLASLGFLLLDMGGVTFLFALPRFREGEFGGAFTLGPVAELPEEGISPVNNPKGKFWLTRPQDGVLALYKVCTHLGCLYAWLDEDNIFRCPCHGSQFEYDGTFIRGPARRSLDRFVVQAVDPDTGEVLAETGAEGEPLKLPDNPRAVIRIDTGRRINGKPRTGLI